MPLLASSAARQWNGSGGRRLLLAHERIVEAGGEIRLTDVALDAGFSSLSAFSSRYAAQFGEPPSATRARGRRRR
ncbi:MAG: helix-turn-helix domain-containing protein [Hyphomicrobium sp.]